MKTELICGVPKSARAHTSGQQLEGGPCYDSLSQRGDSNVGLYIPVSVMFFGSIGHWKDPFPFSEPPLPYLSPLFHTEMSLHLHLPVSFAF